MLQILSSLSSFEMIKDGTVEHVPTDVVDKYTNIMKAFNAVNENEKIMKWKAEH